MIKILFVLATISLLSNPIYNIDSANIQYKLSISATGFPLSFSYEIGVDIDISQAGSINIDLDLGNMPANWSDDIPAELSSLFILTTAEINDKSVEIDGETIALTAGKEQNLMTRYYGANILFYQSTDAGMFSSAKWNTATGIILSLHIEMTDPYSEMTINIDVEYQSGDINIYSDQNALEQFGNQTLAFFTNCSKAF